jgi:hypothetical protein
MDAAIEPPRMGSRRIREQSQKERSDPLTVKEYQHVKNQSICGHFSGLLPDDNGMRQIETNDVPTNRLSFISDVQFDGGVTEVITRIAGSAEGSGLDSFSLNIPVSADELLQGRLGNETKHFNSRPVYMDDQDEQNPSTPDSVVDALGRSVEHFVSFPGNSSTQLQLTFTRANGAVFTRNLELPPPIMLVSPGPSQVVSIGQDFSVTWDASGYPRHEEMIVMIESNPEDPNNDSEYCLRFLEIFATQNTGELTIPAASIRFSEEFTGNQCRVSLKMQTVSYTAIYPVVNDGLAWEINILNRQSNLHNVTLTR